MKKFLIILCVLMMLPIYAFATSSPTIEKTITCKPALTWEYAEQTEGWPDILKRLEDAGEETEGFILFEALMVTLNQKYEDVEWTLPIELTTENEPFVLIIDSEAIVKQEVPVLENGNIVTNFADYEPGIYYICFYIKGA